MATNFDLGKQIGPLPLGAWIVVVGAGVGIALYSRNTNQEPVVVEDTSMEPGVGEGPGWVAVPPPTYPPNTPEPATNEEWGRNAINHLIAQGYPSATADSAVRKYLAVEKLSISEYALITEALRKLGAPPVPLPPGADAPTTPPPTAAPSNDTVMTVTAASRRTFGQSLVITAKVRWREPGSRTKAPTGNVGFIIDDVLRVKKPLINGTAIYVITPYKSMSSTKDRRWVISGRFWGTGDAANTSSNSIVVTLS